MKLVYIYQLISTTVAIGVSPGGKVVTGWTAS